MKNLQAAGEPVFPERSSVLCSRLLGVDGARLQRNTSSHGAERRPWPPSGGKSFASVRKRPDGGQLGARLLEGPGGTRPAPAWDGGDARQRDLDAACRGVQPLLPLKGRSRGGLAAWPPAAGRPGERAGTLSVGTASPCPAAARPACPAEGSGAQPWRLVQRAAH